MHIAEGVLSAPVLIGAGVIAAGFCYRGFQKIEMEELPRVALLSALFFMASFIHVPLGPTSVHLVLNGIVGLILGIGAFPAILVALLIQGLLFGFGGLTTLGVNLLLMALPAWGVFHLSTHRVMKQLSYMPFLAGFVSVLLSACLLVVVLILSGEVFAETARLAFAAYLPVMVIEGIITLFLVRFLKRVYPKAFER